MIFEFDANEHELMKWAREQSPPAHNPPIRCCSPNAGDMAGEIYRFPFRLEISAEPASYSDSDYSFQKVIARVYLRDLPPGVAIAEKRLQ